MKNLKIIFVAIIMIASYSLTAQVAITTDGSSADGSAMLEVKSTTKGFLPPRMTETQRDAISTPATGLIVFCTDCGDNGEAQIYNGTAWTNMIGGAASAGPIPIPNVTSSTGKIWMDRNLGASQVATSSTDSDSYGDLYQWGRAADGHESRTSGTTAALSNTDTPGHGDFIINSSDWRNPQNDNLWQGVSGINNPCPSGYRLPTEAEWTAEKATWGVGADNAAGAFASPLKLPVAGSRSYSNGSLDDVGSYGFYWSSTVDGTSSRSLLFSSSYAVMSSYYRADGFSVRCIKD